MSVLSSISAPVSEHLALGLGSAGGVSPLVRDLGLCLVAAGLLSALFVRIRIPAIAALLVAGVALGPAGLEAISDRASVDTIASLGLTLLLFVIGLEVNLGALLASGRTLVVTGALQVPLTLALATGAFLLASHLGLTLVGGGYGALYLGVAASLSSTLLVAKYLHERRLVDSIAGRLCIGLLVFQDVWAIVFLAVQPSFANPSIAPIALTFVGTIVVGTIAAFGARLILRRGFLVVARAPELVVSLALAWCFGVGLLGANLGRVAHAIGIRAEISVSLEMGALIAGASIATSPYAYEVVSRVVHLRDFFVTLFFVGLGMSIPVPDGAGVVSMALVLAIVAVGMRFVVFLPLLYYTGLDRRNAVNVSAKLAQVSEFCLVIAYLGAKLGHIDGAQVSIVIFAFVLTALATPFLFDASDQLYRRLRGVLERVGIRSRGVQPEAENATPPRLVLLGFHRVASALLAELERNHPALVAETLVIDINAPMHDEIRKRGAHVVYGDIASGEVLRHAGVEAAAVIVSTVPDELLRGITNASVVRQVRALAPSATIIACATKLSDAPLLRDAGADHVFRPPTETALGILPAVFAALDGSMDSFVVAQEESLGRMVVGSEVID